MSANILLDPRARPVLGHRGAAAYAPENTLEGFRRALELGADALELDVQLTADDVVVVLHDPTVDRTTDGTGDVGTLTSAQVSRLDAGARWTRDGGQTFPWRGRGARIPTLDALVEECPGVPLMIDAKSERVAIPLARVLARHRAERQAVVGSFHPRHLRPFAGPAWSRLATRGQGIALLLRAMLGLTASDTPYAALAFPCTAGPVPLPIALLARAAHRHGRPLHLWTVNDEQLARALWRSGVNGLVGDDPGMLRRVRDEEVPGARADAADAADAR